MMRMLRLTSGIKHYCYHFSGCINTSDKWAHYMQMHLYWRHLKCVWILPGEVRARVCVCLPQNVMGQLVGPSGQTDRHMSEDDVMNQLRLLMHRARERWRCCTAENDTKTLDLLLVLTLYFHMQSPLPPAAVSGVGNSPFSSLDLHHSDLGGQALANEILWGQIWL